MNKLGFGFLRLPRQDAQDENSVDLKKTCELVDRFIALGGRYFDTAYTYMNGGSERAVRETLVKRYPREAYELADKLPSWKLKSREDCGRFFEEELERCGVSYFDYYLLHGLDQENDDLCERLGAYEFMKELKRAGKVGKIGFSYHDSPELLDRILTRHPEMEFVQLQINYLDWDSPSIQSAKCYEIAVKHGKRVLVMEPVKGGNLAVLPEQAEKLLRAEKPGESMASWAIRFAASLDQVDVVLSGMNTIGQIDDNLAEKTLMSERERMLLGEAARIIREKTAVPCTGCGYCTEGCPKQIAIPRYFALFNEYSRSPKELWKMEFAYSDVAKTRGRASDCIGCGACERSCPQKLGIIGYLKEVRKVFEKNG
ncbi:MAG: aldo/keto reductase [Clostridia bacterium]|nr:aldo/keto reductase [Clostridia bacterium]